MIRLPTKTEINTLRTFRKPHSLTIYSPYVQSAAPSSDDPNRIQLKNLLKDARRLLMGSGLNERQINDLLLPAYQLLDGDEFRNNYKRGLVLFIGDQFFRYYRLPADCAQQGVSLGSGFKLKPVAKLLDDNINYYVLCVGYNGAHLFRGDRYHVTKLQFQKKPLSMKEELNIDEFPKEQQLHQVAPASQGHGSERSHGQYNETQVNKNLLLKYFRRIDQRLKNFIKDKSTPLVLAGVDYVLSLYRQANTYPHLATEEIRGNMEHTSPDVIRQNACQILAR